MFKLLSTLMRARTQDAAEAMTDANALTILRQQLRDAASGVQSSKRAVAVVMAYAARETENAAQLATKIADLETRAIAALNQNRDDLAQEAAAALADLEAQKTATDKAISHYNTEIRRLRDQLTLAEHRLRALQRGKQIADAAEKTHRLRGSLPDGVMASLQEAEETLSRLQARHDHADAVNVAMGDLDANTPSSTAERLAEAGCGAPLHTSADAILERLRAKAA